MSRSHYGTAFKLKIIELFKIGKSQVSIANELNINKSIVSRLIKKYKATGKIEEVNTGGRPRTTSEQTDQKIVDIVKNNPFISSKEVVNELELQISSSTVRKRLLEQNLISLMPSKKPMLTKKRLKKRLDFAESHTDRTVLLSDESKFNLLNSGGACHCRSDRRIRYARVKIGPSPRDVVKYPLIDPSIAEHSDSFYDISSQSLEQSNDFDGKDSGSILPTNSSVIEIKQEIMQHDHGTDYIENNTITNEAINTNEQESVENNSDLTNSYPTTSVETLNVPANASAIYVQASTTSAKNMKPHLQDSFNPSNFLSQKLELPTKSKKRKPATVTVKDFSDPLDENTSSSKEYNSYEEWSKRKKDLLEIELMEMRNYQVKLDLWEKEKKLQVASSIYTKDIIENQ